MNRVISVTIKEDFLFLATEWLLQNGVEPNSIAAIPRLCVQVLAEQAGNTVSAQAEGLVNDLLMGAMVKRTMPNAKSGLAAPGAAIRSPQTQNMGGGVVTARRSDVPTGDEVQEFVTWLKQHNLTSEECSFVEYKVRREQEVKDKQIAERNALMAKYKSNTTDVPSDCDPSLPIAVTESMEELNAKAEQRKEREDEEMQALEEYNKQLLSQLEQDGQTNRE